MFVRVCMHVCICVVCNEWAVRACVLCVYTVCACRLFVGPYMLVLQYIQCSVMCVVWMDGWYLCYEDCSSFRYTLLTYLHDTITQLHSTVLHLLRTVRTYVHVYSILHCSTLYCAVL